MSVRLDNQYKDIRSDLIAMNFIFDIKAAGMKVVKKPRCKNRVNELISSSLVGMDNNVASSSFRIENVDIEETNDTHQDTIVPSFMLYKQQQQDDNMNSWEHSVVNYDHDHDAMLIGDGD